MTHLTLFHLKAIITLSRMNIFKIVVSISFNTKYLRAFKTLSDHYDISGHLISLYPFMTFYFLFTFL